MRTLTSAALANAAAANPAEAPSTAPGQAETFVFPVALAHLSRIAIDRNSAHTGCSWGQPRGRLTVECGLSPQGL
jgi:hypothetical protein